MAWAVAGATVAGAGLNYIGGQQASKAATAQAERNMQLQMDWNKKTDPFSAQGSREQYVPKLNQLMQGGYQDIQNDPMFQARQAQALEATQRKMGAMGQGIGTNDMLQLQNQAYMQQGSFFDEQYKRLAELSGATRGGGQAPQGMDPSAAGQMAMNPYSTAANLVGGLSSIFGNKGPGSTSMNINSPQAYNENLMVPGGSSYSGGVLQPGNS